MCIEISFTDNQVNTHYAPLAAILAHYHAQNAFEPLKQMPIAVKKRDFSPADKLEQVLISILAGCETLSEVAPRLKSETALASVCGWPRFADQSNLSRLLDALSLKQIEPLRQATTTIWQSHSQVKLHDWRSYLWLDYDLSGLPCSPRAQESQKGYFSGKKTPPDASWHVSAPSDTARQSGRVYSRATVTPHTACNRRWKPPKLL